MPGGLPGEPAIERRGQPPGFPAVFGRGDRTGNRFCEIKTRSRFRSNASGDSGPVPQAGEWTWKLGHKTRSRAIGPAATSRRFCGTLNQSAAPGAFATAPRRRDRAGGHARAGPALETVVERQVTQSLRSRSAPTISRGAVGRDAGELGAHRTLETPEIARHLHPQPKLGTVAAQLAKTQRHLGRHRLLAAKHAMQGHPADAELTRRLGNREPQAFGDDLPEQLAGMGRTARRTLRNRVVFTLNGIARGRLGAHRHPRLHSKVIRHGPLTSIAQRPAWSPFSGCSRKPGTSSWRNSVAASNASSRATQRFLRSGRTPALRPVINRSRRALWRKLLITAHNVTSLVTSVKLRT